MSIRFHDSRLVTLASFKVTERENSDGNPSENKFLVGMIKSPRSALLLNS